MKLDVNERLKELRLPGVKECYEEMANMARRESLSSELG